MISKLEINEEKKSGYIRNCMLAYCKIQDPVLKYNETHAKIFSVDFVVDKGCANDMSIAFGNETKPFTKDEFKENFKCDAILDESFVGNMNTNAQIKGELIAFESSLRPRVYMKEGDKVKDVTKDILVGNGSIGDIAFTIMTNSYGTFYKLQAVLVTTLIEYVPQESNPFGEVVESESTDEENDLPF